MQNLITVQESFWKQKACDNNINLRDHNTRYFTSRNPIIKDELLLAIQRFFTSRHLLTQWNHTILLPIPKVKKSQNVSNFRPINQCNTLYKVVSKLLTNRLKLVLEMESEYLHSR